jgi:signal transduction histidine kinase
MTSRTHPAPSPISAHAAGTALALLTGAFLVAQLLTVGLGVQLSAAVPLLALGASLSYYSHRVGQSHEEATISTAHARAEVRQLAEEQAALRQVATLVQRGVAPHEVFAAVAREVGQLLRVDGTHMGRFEVDGTASLVAGWSPAGIDVPVGTRVPVEGESICALVLRTGAPARIDSYDDASGPIAVLLRDLGVGSSVGAPIVVDGRLWGAMIVSSKAVQPLPADTEARIVAFTELVATAIASSETRTQVERLAEEQAALRRVATLIAREPSPDTVFTAIAAEVGRLLRVSDTRLLRFEEDGAATILAEWGAWESSERIGSRSHTDGDSLCSLVFQTRRAARIDDAASAAGPVGGHAIRSAVATPIVVDGRVWGAICAGSRRPEPLPAGTEARVGQFTELAATAISNIQARSELAASRARIVAAADQERGRVVRDLHDGAQQRLVHTVLTLRLARDALPRRADGASALVSEALEQAERATEELRELAHGILPGVLTRGGLRAAVEVLASRVTVPVAMDVSVGRLPAAAEATAYFVIAETLTNVAKHSDAAGAAVTAHAGNGVLEIEVQDDGVGGARAAGSGLLGLADRLAAVDGRLRIETPAGGGTLVAASIPLTPP